MTKSGKSDMEVEQGKAKSTWAPPPRARKNKRSGASGVAAAASSNPANKTKKARQQDGPHDVGVRSTIRGSQRTIARGPPKTTKQTTRPPNNTGVLDAAMFEMDDEPANDQAPSLLKGGSTENPILIDFLDLDGSNATKATQNVAAGGDNEVEVVVIDDDDDDDDGISFEPNNETMLPDSDDNINKSPEPHHADKDSRHNEKASAISSLLQPSGSTKKKQPVSLSGILANVRNVEQEFDIKVDEASPSSVAKEAVNKVRKDLNTTSSTEDDAASSHDIGSKQGDAAMLDSDQVEMDSKDSFTKSHRSFDEMLAILKQHHCEFGSLFVPKDGPRYKGVDLGIWLLEIRREKAANRLSTDQEKALDFLWNATPIWNIEDEYWEVWFRYLKAFHRPTCPLSGRTTVDTWADEQRRARKNGTLSIYQIQQLNSIKFEWEPRPVSDHQGREQPFSKASGAATAEKAKPSSRRAEDLPAQLQQRLEQMEPTSYDKHPISEAGNDKNLDKKGDFNTAVAATAATGSTTATTTLKVRATALQQMKMDSVETHEEKTTPFCEKAPPPNVATIETAGATNLSKPTVSRYLTGTVHTTVPANALAKQSPQPPKFTPRPTVSRYLTDSILEEALKKDFPRRFTHKKTFTEEDGSSTDYQWPCLLFPDLAVLIQEMDGYLGEEDKIVLATKWMEEFESRLAADSKDPPVVLFLGLWEILFYPQAQDMMRIHHGLLDCRHKKNAMLQEAMKELQQSGEGVAVFAGRKRTWSFSAKKSVSVLASAGDKTATAGAAPRATVAPRAKLAKTPNKEDCALARTFYLSESPPDKPVAMPVAGTALPDNTVPEATPAVEDNAKEKTLDAELEETSAFNGLPESVSLEATSAMTIDEKRELVRELYPADKSHLSFQQGKSAEASPKKKSTPKKISSQEKDAEARFLYGTATKDFAAASDNTSHTALSSVLNSAYKKNTYPKFIGPRFRCGFSGGPIPAFEPPEGSNEEEAASVPVDNSCSRKTSQNHSHRVANKSNESRFSKPEFVWVSNADNDIQHPALLLKREPGRVWLQWTTSKRKEWKELDDIKLVNDKDRPSRRGRNCRELHATNKSKRRKLAGKEAPPLSLGTKLVKEKKDDGKPGGCSPGCSCAADPTEGALATTTTKRGPNAHKAATNAEKLNHNMEKLPDHSAVTEESQADIPYGTIASYACGRPSRMVVCGSEVEKHFPGEGWNYGQVVDINDNLDSKEPIYTVKYAGRKDVEHLTREKLNHYLLPPRLSQFEEFHGYWENLKPEDIEKSSIIRQANRKISAHDIVSNSQTNAQYGRILPVGTRKIFDVLKLRNSDRFVDVGHGIGNMVFQAGYCVGCEARGIEVISDRFRVSQSLAAQLDNQISPMRLAGEIHLLRGDLSDRETHNWLVSGTKIFVNNYNGVFSERMGTGQDPHYHLDHYVAGILASLKEGSLLISLTDLRLGMSQKEVNQWRKANKLPPDPAGSYFEVVKVNIGMAKDVFSWVQSSEDPVHLFVYRRVKQRVKKNSKDRMSTILCCKRGCPHSKKATPISAVTINANGKVVAGMCQACRYTGRSQRDIPIVSYQDFIDPTGDYREWGLI